MEKFEFGFSHSPVEQTERQRWTELANELEAVAPDPKADITLLGLVKRLRSGDAATIKHYCMVQCDKLNGYKIDIERLMIEKFYGGEGSPWKYKERTMKEEKAQ